MTKYFLIAGLIVGAIAGYAYWYYIGCYSGTCPITSNWHISMGYGGFMGALGAMIIKDVVVSRKKKK